MLPAAATMWSSANAREQRLPVLQHEHIPARADLRFVAQLAGLHPCAIRTAETPHFLAGHALTGDANRGVALEPVGIGHTEIVAPAVTGEVSARHLNAINCARGQP